MKGLLRLGPRKLDCAIVLQFCASVVKAVRGFDDHTLALHDDRGESNRNNPLACEDLNGRRVRLEIDLDFPIRARQSRRLRSGKISLMKVRAFPSGT